MGIFGNVCSHKEYFFAIFFAINRKMWVWGYEFRKKIINLCPSIVNTVTEWDVHMPEPLPKDGKRRQGLFNLHLK